MSTTLAPKTYQNVLKEIKEKILSSQTKAALAVNRELITLYWEIGTKIYRKQQNEGWGAKTIENLAKDLKHCFPNMQGFSSRNLKYMVHFAKAYPDFSFGQQVVAQIPWGHNILLLQKLNSSEERIWYANKTIENGWSRSTLLHWLNSELFQREGQAITNFQNTLPTPQSDLADQTLKDPYCFDFLTLREIHNEQELESGLLDHIQHFLLELGAGFSFVGRQVHLEIGSQDFYSARFFARDFLQQLFCRLRTVGLKSTPLCKIFISFGADLASAKKFSAACSSKDILPQVDCKNGCLIKDGSIGKIQNKMEIPLSCSKDQLRLFWNTFGEIVLLKGSHAYLYSNPFPQGIQRQGVAFNRIGTFVEMDTAIFVKTDRRNGFCFQDGSVFVGFANRENRIAGHLRPQRGRASNVSVNQVMQGDSVPTSVLYNKWNDLITCRKICLSKSQKLLVLLTRHVEAYTNGSFHWEKRMLEVNYIFNLNGGATLPPGPKGPGFRVVMR